MNDASQPLLVALAGNPNCGKTTLFNAITGARQHVGNYPGITVEKKEGFCNFRGTQIRLVDLPGIYSLTAYSPEELVARDFLVQERPSAVINIVDASNIERNLYLTIQLMELGIPLVLALNMIDAAANRGIEIDAEELSRRLHVPVVPAIARSGKGKEEILHRARDLAGENRPWVPLVISYGPDIDPVLVKMEALIEAAGFLTELHPPRWTALKYLEADEQVMEKGRRVDPDFSSRLERMGEAVGDHLQKTLATYPEAIIADHRYGYITALLKGSVVKRNEKADRLYLSDQVDRVLTHRFLGPILMMAILYVVYQFTFTYSAAPVAWLEAAFSWLGGLAEASLPDGPLKSLIVSGVIDGVGGVLGFVPLILFMFLAIAFLEDTGYLARVAYMLDRIFRTFGLHGNSVMAYVISGGIAGGCAVPGVMATRTLRSSRERLATILTAPIMNCGAKLPVFAMLIAAFFPAKHAQIMFFLTVLSWIMALLLARLFRSTILRGPSTPFLLELPPYRLPTFRGLLIHTWERTRQYIQKAGTIILAMSILFWSLMSFPGLPDTQRRVYEEQRSQILAQVPEGFSGQLDLKKLSSKDLPLELVPWYEQLKSVDRAEAHAALKHSWAGRAGSALEVFSRWMGGDWRTNVALAAGFAAKELIISIFGTAYSLGVSSKDEGGSLSRQLASDPGWNPLRAFSFILFIMLYAPCLATVTCIIRESGSWKWGLFSMVFNTSAAFLLAVLIYQGGRWLGIGA
ncbi:MAG: ferrous iron transport protein B [Syntrophobacteraceae bacterium]|nr:ferrous iron transport protein B [Syntrophobacteraceae bacterium]